MKNNLAIARRLEPPAQSYVLSRPPPAAAPPEVGISLTALAETLPSSWLEFAPSPIRSYVDPVRAELVELDVIGPGDRAFQTFSGVPRYFHPRADAEALALSLELICWYFYFDDPFDDGEIDAETTPLVERMVRVLETGIVRDDATPVETLCLRFRTRAQRMRSDGDASFQRFIDLCKDWVLSIRPINRQLRSDIPDLETYKRLRLVNVGIVPEYALNELISGNTLDEAFIANPDVKRFGDLAALVIAFFNDIYSYERESKKRTQLNSLELRQTKGGLSLESAYHAQLDDIRAMVAEMEAIEARLTAAGAVGLSTTDDTPAIARRRRAQSRHLEDVKAIVVGNHLWSHSDGRYYSPSSPFTELRSRRPDRRRRAGIAPGDAN
jgi:hypothetical protein